MNVFELRERLVGDYADCTRSFIAVRDERVSDLVESERVVGVGGEHPALRVFGAFSEAGRH